MSSRAVFVRRLLPFLDVFLAILVYPAACVLKFVRVGGISHLPLSRRALLSVGVFPIRRHYYEPQFDYRGIDLQSLPPRTLPGINWKIEEQVELLRRFNFASELKNIPLNTNETGVFYMENGSFCSGDAEVWYQMVRYFRPRKIIEIGSGFSTLLAKMAVAVNSAEDGSYSCDHICVEPYEMPWLESVGATIIRRKVEDLDLSFFSQLADGDIRFIDSSHVIRPHGDVLCEYLQILPSLAKGVIVHVHDIFSPRNYLSEWLEGDVLFWNEQYLLEAFLTENEKWSVLAGVNMLSHAHPHELMRVAPFMDKSREPGSFYIRKTS